MDKSVFLAVYSWISQYSWLYTHEIVYICISGYSLLFSSDLPAAAAASQEKTPAATDTEEPMETDHCHQTPPTGSPSTRKSPSSVESLQTDRTPSPNTGTPAKSPASSLTSEDPADLSLSLQFLKEAHNHLGRSDPPRVALAM